MFLTQLSGAASPQPAPLISPLPPPPSITAVEPNHAYNDQPAYVSVSGGSFAATPAVTLGLVLLPDVTFVSASRLKVTIPAGLVPGTYGLRLCNPDGQCAERSSAFTVDAVPPPDLLRIIPAEGLNDAPNDVILYGHALRPGIQVTVGITALQEVVRISDSEVHAVIPAGWPAGIYDVIAHNPAQSQAGTLLQAYTVASLSSDDLFAGLDDLWTLPNSIRAGEQVTLGLNVRRQGGVQPVQVEVAFFLGDPAHAGTPIGRATSQPLPAGSGVEAVAVPWNTAGLTSTAHVYAVIDPDGLISETNEVNNVVDRTITLRSPGRDAIPPRVTSLLINAGARVTYSPNVTLTITAIDTGGAGLHAMYLVEWMFSMAARHWVMVQRSGWVSYQSTYALTLTERGGLHFIQAWVADSAGNISTAPALRKINYVPVRGHVRKGQIHLYWHELDAGQRVTLTLQTFNGDADLYVWAPLAAQAWWSNNGGMADDTLVLTATQTGLYVIEVYGYEDSEYNLGISLDGYAGVVRLSANQPRAVNTPRDDKPVLSQPAISADSEPVLNSALPDSPVIIQVFVPVVQVAGPGVSYATFLPAVIQGQ